MKKYLQGRILPRQYLWKIMSLNIQEQVATNHTGSRKKTWLQEYLVQEESKITNFGNRSKDLLSFFDMENKLCYCTNIPGLFSVSGIVKLYHSIYQQKDWGSRGTFISKEYNVKEMILVDKVKVLLPPLHIKLGLRKNFVKTLDRNGAANTCLLCSQVLVLLSSLREFLLDFRFEKCWRILILRSFLT